MKRRFKSILCVMLALVMTAAVAAPVSAAYPSADESLRFRPDGSFTILQFTDTQDTQWPSPNLLTLIQKAIDTSKPDLVVFTGDQLKNYDSDYGKNGHDWKVKKALHAIIQPAVARGIPFAFAFGNHDSQLSFTLEEQVAFLQKYKGCLVKDEGPTISGCGNYNVPVLGSSGDAAAFNLYFLDSNQSKVLPDQIDWYIAKSSELKVNNGGAPVPSIEFQHIVPYNDDLVGAFAAQGDVKASFFGHNHYRSDNYNWLGIELYYTPTAGFNEFAPGRDRGARVIKLNENEPDSIETYILTFNDLFDDNPITDCRYLLFTLGEIQGNAWEKTVSVLSSVSQALLYLAKISQGNPGTVISELFVFFGFDSGLREYR